MQIILPQSIKGERVSVTVELKSVKLYRKTFLFASDLVVDLIMSTADLHLACGTIQGGTAPLTEGANIHRKKAYSRKDDDPRECHHGVSAVCAGIFRLQGCDASLQTLDLCLPLVENSCAAGNFKCLSKEAPPLVQFD
jgi:hypothetical protein